MRRPAPWLAPLIEEEVHERLRNDPRTLAKPGTLLGWSHDQVYSTVIEGGQAEFDQPIGDLLGADRALLYARFNLPRHLDELGDAFGQLFSSFSRAGTPTLIDLGCGPFTAGLSLAEALGPESAFHYHGFDRATSMGELGRRFAEGARRRGALHGRTTWGFGSDLDGHDFGKLRNDMTIVVASYVLASRTIEAGPLASSVLRAIKRIGPGPAVFLYTNSATPWSNRNFAPFRDALVAGGFKVVFDGVERFLQTRNPADLRYALLFREAQATIDLGGEAP